ncbi:MAG: error-prone DNA polymerase [Planctomycetes bacterium]|nr:error-prone DNA polymerase [Planctomycetota bacterium]
MTYAELHCKTNFSFLEGASHANELATRAAELGLHALAITDRNSLAGVVRAHQAAKAANLKLLIGAEITPTDGAPIVLLAMNLAGYRNLSQLITRGRRAAPKGECRLTVEDIASHAPDLLAIILPPQSIDNYPFPISNFQLKKTDAPIGNCKVEIGNWKCYRDIFAERVYLAAAVHLGPDDDAELERAAAQARQCRLPLLATNQVHYHVPARRRLHEVLTAVRHHTTVANLGALRFANGERHLKSPAQMVQLFAQYPDAIRRTVEVAERCHFSLDELRYEYPDELCPPGKTPTEHLADLTWAGANDRYSGGIPEKVRDLLHRELALIAELRYEAFFLTVWDIVVFARARGILCQGRGSAANSAVCYCLGITSVDPDRADLLFERFISKERNEAPDIDVDFEHERREEVFQYIYAKYGRERAGIVAEVITYQPRSAVRDVGKALGLSLDAVDRLAKAIDWHVPLTPNPSPSGGEGGIAERIREAGLTPDATNVRHLVELTAELIGFPRHLSQHVGGFVITGRPLSEMVPIENAAMADRTVIEWDKDDLDALGILKVDCLALGMLTAIQKCFELIGPVPWLRLAPAVKGPANGASLRALNEDKLTLATIPAEDSIVYDMICKADTIGVFQIESRAQMSMLPRLQPRCFYDLVVEVAIVRPGPIQGGMVHPYLRRRSGQEPVSYPNPIVEQVLSKTLGVPLFQEQVMRLAIVAAGFTPGEADQLRRAMGAWKRSGTIDKFRDKFRAGLLSRGFPIEFAEQLYAQIAGFGEYGFPESHAASFALLAYVSAWLKCHYPAEFAAAIINSQPMGFYGAAQLIHDAQAHGVAVLPIDVNHSAWDCTIGPFSRSPLASADVDALPSARQRRAAKPIRLGFRLIKGFSSAHAANIVTARNDAPFRSIADFARRGRLSRALVARLAAADAFRSLGLDRRAALWKALAIGEDLPLFAGLDEDVDLPALPEMPIGEHVVADYQSTGLSLKAHPISLIRGDLDRLDTVSARALDQLPDKATVRIAGLVLVRQRPATANGTVFMSLEDETGLMNLIIWRRTWERFRKVARDAVALFIEGKIERADRVIHVCPTNIQDLSHALRDLASRSRDFR